MDVQRIILGPALLMLVGCQTIGGESMPTLTRTGEVKDVIVRDTIEPTSVMVRPGDEIRWINKRQGAVRVIFLNPMTENLTCQRNFGGPMGFGTKRNEYSTKLGSNETASLCFRDPGEVKYCGQGRIGESPQRRTEHSGHHFNWFRKHWRADRWKSRSGSGLAARSDKGDAASSR